jgi:hypothetical protein
MMKINLIAGRIKPREKQKGREIEKTREGKQYTAKEALDLVTSWEERDCRIILMGLLMGFPLQECVREMEKLRNIRKEENRGGGTIIV